MSDDLPDSIKTAVLHSLEREAWAHIRHGGTRDEVVHALQKRGMKPETARAFLKRLESTVPELDEVLARNEEMARLRLVKETMRANYPEE